MTPVFPTGGTSKVDGNALAAHAELIDNVSRGSEYPMFELRRRQAACPAIEKLHGVYTCFHLSRQILYCEIRNGVDDRSKSGWVSIGHPPRKAVILGALSRAHKRGEQGRASCRARVCQSV